MNYALTITMSSSCFKSIILYYSGCAMTAFPGKTQLIH